MGLAAVFLPSGYVFSRYFAAIGYYSKSDDLTSLTRLVARFYSGVFPGLVAIIIAQAVIPGQFKGSDGLLVAFIVLALGKLSELLDISQTFRKLESRTPYIPSRKVILSSGLVARTLRRHVRY
jgi:hypothetical protein